MPPAVKLQARPAARGLAYGPLMWMSPATGTRVASNDPALERAALQDAIGKASASISALMATSEGEGADIIEFQLAMLEDESLSAPVFDSVAAGADASTAWRLALDAMVAEYEGAEEEYFRARAADLCDMRDRVLRVLSGDSTTGRLAPGTVLAGEDMPPTLFLETDWSQGGGLVLTAGSTASHVAMLARARGVPMVVGAGTADFAAHDYAIVDGTSGRIILSPSQEDLAELREEEIIRARQVAEEAAFLFKPAVTLDGIAIEVLVNVAGVGELAGIDRASCDGIGLMRTEFLFRDGAPLPGEEEQFEAYAAFLQWAGGKPVTIRTLDIGADKPLRGVTIDNETNPFLGLRGLRLSLSRPDLFRQQLRALARASALGPLKVMWPMVTTPEEFSAAETMFDAELASLRAQNIDAARPRIGMMVEVPAAAIAPELFNKAEFLSIGSNDLTQYVTAASRDSVHVAGLNDPAHPAVLKLIAQVAAYGAGSGIPVSLCGDMASEPAHLEALLRAGVRSISVAPAALARVKAAISMMHANEV